jgi:hypothetical protein
MENLDDLLLATIISFVGCNQYRFVAAISKRLEAAYRNIFPDNKIKYMNASTMEHAKICVDAFSVTKWKHSDPPIADGTVAYLCCTSSDVYDL